MGLHIGQFNDSDLQILHFKCSNEETSRDEMICCKTQCFSAIAQIVFSWIADLISPQKRRRCKPTQGLQTMMPVININLAKDVSFLLRGGGGSMLYIYIYIDMYTCIYMSQRPRLARDSHICPWKLSRLDACRLAVAMTQQSCDACKGPPACSLELSHRLPNLGFGAGRSFWGQAF